MPAAPHDASTGVGGRPPAELTVPLSVDTLQRLQDRFAALGRVTVCICTVEGTPITRPTWGSRYSQLVGTSPRGRDAFAQAMRAVAADPTAKVPSICHEGLNLYRTVIEHDDRAWAIIVVGTRPVTTPDRRTVKHTALRYALEFDELWDAATRIDRALPGTPDAIHRFADVLGETIATMYAQAVQIERQLADLHAVHGLAELLSGTLHLQEILDVTVRRVTELLAMKACAIRLLNPNTGELTIKAVHNLSEEYLRKGPVVISENAIDAAAFAGESVYIEDTRSDPRIRYPENAKREGIISGLCVPMTYRGVTIGVMRVYADRVYRFTESEQSLLRSIASQAAAAIINSRLRHEHAEAERVRRQVEAAGAIQQRMLPEKPPTHARLSFGCVYDPTLALGGDFYDFLRRPDGRVVVCIADVVGKGLPAALLMASIRATIHGYADQSEDVAWIMSRVNRRMYDDTLVSEFATVVLGELTTEGDAFTYCNAGHPPPYLLRGDDIIELTAGGLVVGVDPDAPYARDTMRLERHDILVMVTDGVMEAIAFDGTAYGRNRLIASVRKHRALDAPQLAAQLLWDLRRFVGLAEQTDDITIVVIKVA